LAQQGGIPADQIDTSRPHPARMYDYYLGGHDNYEVDRDAAEQVLAAAPVVRDAALANRAFMHRAVRQAATMGMRQFIDIGTGIPTSPNTHEVASEVHPDARVVYVDNDPIVGAYANALLRGSGSTAFSLADVRKPRDILGEESVRRLIDFTEPVCLMLVAVLHFVEDGEDPAGIVATLRDALPAGSLLIFSHSSVEEAVDDRRVTGIYRNASATLTPRSRAHISALLSGFEMLEPGLVQVNAWRPDEPVGPDDREVGLIGGIGRKL
jgi:hypothetical protein